MANRLTSPAPLVRVGDWARTWAVEEVSSPSAAASARRWSVRRSVQPAPARTLALLV
ncbi:hypothetical protein [Streptomyces chryseus]|uniref:hypothetical protein n=1 Tax=Streptomyces chryseus TaxID=68186 RepID=UPI001671C07F|nr:hypothetical protein [Streptomyces chryseus]